MKLHPSIRPFADEIDAFIERTGISATRLGKIVLNDEHFVRDLRAGRNPTLETVDKIRTFMRRREKVSA